MQTSREPQLLRFRLRQMFFVVTVLSVLCALLVVTTGAWPLVIGFGSLLVAAHVGGNLIGTRLRDSSQEMRNQQAPALGNEADLPAIVSETVEFSELDLPDTTPLANFGPIGGRAFGLVLAGTLLGAALGGSLIALTIGTRITWPGFIVGTISCSVLGAWAAFLASSFGTIAHHAWRHANESGK